MTADPKTLTPADVPGLSGRELDAAVEWFVYGDDLTANTDERIVAAMRRGNRQGFYWLYASKVEIGLLYESAPRDGSVPIDPEEETLVPDREHLGSWGWGDYCALFTWRSRQGRRWQYAVESAVAAITFDPRPFTADANLFLAFWEPGGVLVGVAPIPPNYAIDEDGNLDDEWYINGQGEHRIRNTVADADIKLAACRAAVLEAMRRKGT